MAKMSKGNNILEWWEEHHCDDDKDELELNDDNFNDGGQPCVFED